MKKILPIIILSVFLSGCGEATMDTSSKEAIGQSMAKMQKDMSASDKEKMNKVVVQVMFQSGFAGKTDAERDELLKSKLDGKTAKEIIAMGEKQ